MVDKEKIIEINEKRNAVLHAPYMPLVGKGSPIERFPFYLDRNTEIFLPVSMKNDPLIKAAHEFETLNDFLNYSFKNSLPSERSASIREATLMFHKQRLSYDFEFWSASCAKIQDEEGQHIHFVLNPPQRDLLFELEKMRIAGAPIRVILLKARQWGGSTLLRLYMSWIQILIKTGWGAAVIASVESQAMHIRGMFNIVAMHHPEDIFRIKLKPYRGSQKNREIDGRNCVIGVGSYEEPDNLRSFTFQMIHLSECAFWQQTANKTPESIIQALRSTVPRIPYSLIALESTANGVGNFFHREWQKAKSGRSAYSPVFVPWFRIPKYSIPIKDRHLYSFVENMTPEDWEKWELGATLEGINWYKIFMREENYSQEAMSAEYPSSATEAFVTSGQRIFPVKYVLNLRKGCIPPEFVGELHGEEATGPKALDRIELQPEPKGNLWLWQMPDYSEPRVTDRYVVFVDIGGRTAKADKSVIRVLDRYWMVGGGKPEFVATWRGNTDPDIVAWKSAQIAKWYLNALLIVEDNSLDKEDDGAGNFFTILDEIADHYENLYSRTDPDKIREGIPAKYGFWTNKKSKPMIINALLAAARDDEYIERDERACDEMDTFEQKENKSMGAQEGCFDDLVIATAGDVWAAFKYLDPPVYIVKKDKAKKKTIIGEATI